MAGVGVFCTGDDGPGMGDIEQFLRDGTSPVLIERVLGCGTPLGDGSHRCPDQHGRYRDPHLSEPAVLLIIACLVVWFGLFLYLWCVPDRYPRPNKHKHDQCDGLLRECDRAVLV